MGATTLIRRGLVRRVHPAAHRLEFIACPAPCRLVLRAATAPRGEAHRQLRRDHAHERRVRPARRTLRPLQRVAPGGWCHIDLFPAREKNQDALKTALTLDNRARWHRLAREWFEIGVELLAALQPRVVVVVNAFASDLLHDEASRRWSLEWNSAGGRHEGTLPHGTVPFFFSGMLTGGHALDRYSRQRLEWHIERALADAARREDAG